MFCLRKFDKITYYECKIIREFKCILPIIINMNEDNKLYKYVKLHCIYVYSFTSYIYDIAINDLLFIKLCNICIFIDIYIQSEVI